MTSAEAAVGINHAGERPWRVPAILFGFALVVGLATVAIAFRAQTLVDNRFDPYYFGAMGKSLARGQGFLPFGVLIQRRAPLYPLLIGGLYKAFGERPLVVQLAQCLFFALTCVLVYDLGRRLFNRRTGLIAGVVCAVHPLMLRYVADFHLETFFTFLLTLTVWLTVRFKERPSIARGAQVGLAAGLASLTKAVALLYPPLFAAGVLVTAVMARRRGRVVQLPWMPLVVLAVVMALVITPWTIRNYVASGHFVPISSGTSDAILRGYIFSKPDYALLRKPPYTDAENECNAYFRKLCHDAGTECEKNDWETDQILNREAKARIKADPGAFVSKFFVGLFTFWYEMTSWKNSFIAGVLALIAWIFAVVGTRRAWREGRPAWLLLLPVLYLNLLLAALLALGRYSAPILPALLVVAAFGVDTLLSNWKAHRSAARA
jgi:4-amino-4-deoxy-L-arabinose transferase-like glycosyltransferase